MYEYVWRRTTRYVGSSCGKPWRYGVSVDVLGFRAINQASEACLWVGSEMSGLL